ncbi:YesK family protein [Oceanobacillus sp. CFH 90083]|uniref:YesK family protein n=1 Tax=Oceanobacillus sp. CFH 90083 TaxID=2592336 RepID=UPI00128CF4EA
METLFYILVFGVVIFLLSMLFKEKRIVPPLTIILISIVAFIISILIGGWEGIGLAYMSFNAFTASIINIFIMTIINKSKKNKKPGN